MRDSELDRLRQSPAYVRPVKRYLGTNPATGEEFYAYDTPLDEVLEAMYATQPETFQDVKDFAERERRGDFKHREEADMFDPDMVI